MGLILRKTWITYPTSSDFSFLTFNGSIIFSVTLLFFHFNHYKISYHIDENHIDDLSCSILTKTTYI